MEVVRLGETGRIMCHGEFESLKAIYRATPGFCPKPYAWGRYKMEEAYFLLVEFRYVGHQVRNLPPEDRLNLSLRMVD